MSHYKATENEDLLLPLMKTLADHLQVHFIYTQAYSTLKYVQWNLSNPDTIMTDYSVLNSEVSILISGVVKYTNVTFGSDESL